MILQCYSIYDIKADIYHVPNFCHNTAHAKRVYAIEIGKSQTVFHQYPEDFRIFHVASYDDSTGIMKPVEPVHYVCEMQELVVKQPGNEDKPE